MERACEFCTSLRPVVYCKADEAYLCLSCDAKVHKANALSSRHLRTLLCNLCRNHFAYVQCLDHRILICHSCDQKLHDPSLKHQKRAIRSYMGCPSAKDFAVLWVFELNEIEDSGFADLDAVNLRGKSSDQTGGHSMVSGAKFDGESSSQQGQKLYKDQERQIILQQIIDLKRLQLFENINHTELVNGQQETVSSNPMYRTRKNYDEKCDKHTQNSQDFNSNPQERDSPMAEVKLESLSSTFSDLDNLPSSPMIDIPLNSNFHWTSKSTLQSNQLWPHNIQDLGMCEELISHDDFNIPDVDLTFQNFEELFGGDQDLVRGLVVGDDNDLSCSSIEKDISLDKSDIFNERTMEDSSEAVTITISQFANEDVDIAHPNQYDPINMDLPGKIRPSHSTISFFVSRFNHDIGLSPHSKGKGNCSYFPELEVSNMVTGGNDSGRINEKKSQQHEKQTRGQTRKPGANVRKRMKGQIAKAESY